MGIRKKKYKQSQKIKLLDKDAERQFFFNNVKNYQSKERPVHSM